jgi:tetratricopeptide (TPR) repeat protein
MAVQITIAGPAAGLAVAALGLGVLKLGPLTFHHPWSPSVHDGLVEFVQINAFWSVINLLPVMPFDGGQVLAYLLGPSRQSTTALISLVFGCLAAALLYRLGLSIAAVVFLAASILQFFAAKRLQSQSAPNLSARQIETLLEQARRALSDGDHDAAQRLARAVIELGPGAELRRKAAEVYAWAALGRNQLAEARQALLWMSDGAIDPLLQAALLEADGDCERAVNCLRQARAVGDLRPQVGASLVRLLLSIERYGEAALTTIQILEHVSNDEARQVVRACREGGRPIPAVELAEALFTKTGNVDDLLTIVAGYVSANQLDAARSTLALALSKQVTPNDVEASPIWAEVAAAAELTQLLERARTATK